MKIKSIAFVFAMIFLPQAAPAQAVELTQAQLRQLVVEQQVISSESVVANVAQNFGGVVKDIRGFFLDGQMTYRLLLQRDDGQVVEILVNGVDGRQVSHQTPMGQIVSSVARATNGSSNSASNGNAVSNANRANNADRGNSSRGNSSSNRNDRGNGNSGSSRGNSGGKGNGRNN